MITDDELIERATKAYLKKFPNADMPSKYCSSVIGSFTCFLANPNASPNALGVLLRNTHRALALFYYYAHSDRMVFQKHGAEALQKEGV